MTTPVTGPTDVPLPTYATYFDARLLVSAEDVDAHRVENWSRRWQFVALPPAPGRPDKLVMFYRAQDHRTHRAVWRSSTFKSYTTMLDQYVATLNEWCSPAAPLSWIGPPIVVGLTPAEISEYVLERKTPWKVLERAGRQARKLGFRI